MTEDIHTQTQAETDDDTRTISVKMERREAQALRVLAVEQEKSAPDLIREAIRFWWAAKYEAILGEWPGRSRHVLPKDQ